MKKLIAGNWKMNGGENEARQLVADIVNAIHLDRGLLDSCEFAVFPTFLHIGTVRHTLRQVMSVSWGAQDCSPFDNGAHTGEVSARMLREAGCRYVIAGHSERRQNNGETDDIIRRKLEQIHGHGMTAILCVGETEGQRERGEQNAVVRSQLEAGLPDTATAENTVIAYEPVWAIGTGKTATPEDIKDMHGFIHGFYKGRILYGGSMKPANAGEILKIPHVHGGLIGGASLKADEFLGIASKA